MVPVTNKQKSIKCSPAVIKLPAPVDEYKWTISG